MQLFFFMKLHKLEVESLSNDFYSDLGTGVDLKCYRVEKISERWPQWFVRTNLMLEFFVSWFGLVWFTLILFCFVWFWQCEDSDILAHKNLSFCEGKCETMIWVPGTVQTKKLIIWLINNLNWLLILLYKMNFGTLIKDCIKDAELQHNSNWIGLIQHINSET